MKNKIFCLISLGFLLSTSMVFALYREFTTEDALTHFDFYATYGNQGIEVDKENLRLTFRHKHNDEKDNQMSLSYKHFRVEIKEESDYLIEFHLIPERSKLIDDMNQYRYFEGNPEIDFDKAYESFRRGYRAPKHQSHASLHGAHIYRKDTRTKYFEAMDSKLIIKIEQYTVETTPNGVLFRVETTIPTEPYPYSSGLATIPREKFIENLKKQIEKSGLTLEEYREQFQENDGAEDTRLLIELLDEMLDESQKESPPQVPNDASEDDKSVYMELFNRDHTNQFNNNVKPFGVYTTEFTRNTKHYDWGDIFGTGALNMGVLKGDIDRGYGITVLRSDLRSIAIVVSEGEIDFEISRFYLGWAFEAEFFNSLYFRPAGLNTQEVLVAYENITCEAKVEIWNALPFSPRAKLQLPTIIADLAIADNPLDSWDRRARYFSSLILELDVSLDDDLTGIDFAIQDRMYGIDEWGNLVGVDYVITINL